MVSGILQGLGPHALQVRGDYYSLLKPSKSPQQGWVALSTPTAPLIHLVPALQYWLLETPEVQICLSVKQNKYAGQDG